jgi:excisionase family DNA binding protein
MTKAYNIEEVCSRSSLGRTTIYQEIKAGRLRAKKIGRRTAVLETDYNLWMESLPELSTAPHKADERNAA